MMYTARSSRRRSLISATSSLAHAQPGPGAGPMLLTKTLQQLPLLLREPRRDFYLDGDEQIALAPCPLRSPPAADAERPSLGRSGRDLQRHRSVQGRDLHVCTEGRLRIRDGKLQGEIWAPPAEELVGCHAHRHEQVSGSSPRRSRLPPARQTDPGAVLERDPDLRLQIRTARGGTARTTTKEIEDVAQAARVEAQILEPDAACRTRSV